jgi:2'-5' RNA ligase
MEAAHSQAPLILTLALDALAFARLDVLRCQHFPPERNLVPAHLTLFHALPGREEAAVRQTLRAVTAGSAIVTLHFPTLVSLGRGTAVVVDSPELLALRSQLARRWASWLSAQDRQGYHPHITIQNKVTPAAARQLFTTLVAGWQPFTARGEGLLLWRYLNGPWELIERFAFAGA